MKSFRRKQQKRTAILGRWSIALCIPLICSTVLAGELSFKASISAEVVNQDVDSELEQRSFSTDNLIINPRFAADYRARLLDARVDIEHNHVRRSLDEDTATNNYVSYTAGTTIRLIENLSTLSVRFNQDYRGFDQVNFLTDDFLLNAENLVKTTNAQANLSFKLEPRKLVGFNSNLSFSKLDSEEDANASNIRRINFNNESYGLNFGAQSGQELRNLNFTLNGNFREVKRGDREDFRSANALTDIGIPFLPNWDFLITASYENNEIQNASIDVEEALREFYSYGAGLRWRPSRGRLIQLAINRSTTEDSFSEEDEENDFLSARIDWDFSNRTQLNASYTRRFFGDAAKVSFSHNAKHWRNRLSYDESVTNNSQLIQNNELGIFACNTGFTSLDDCNLLDSLDPNNIPVGSELVPFVETNFEINDNVIIRKRGSYYSALKLRRTRLSATISRSEDEDVERLFLTTTDSLRIDGSLQFGSRSSIRMTLSHADIERELEADLLESTVKEFSLSLERRFRNRLFASIGYRYLDRDGDDLNGFGGGGNVGGLRGPLTDNRITASIRYEFTNRR